MINFIKENILALIIIICFIWLTVLEIKEPEEPKMYIDPIQTDETKRLA